MYYVINTAGYECYEPYWFCCNCSQEEFKTEVLLATDKAVELLLKSDNYINGRDLLMAIIDVLSQKGFNYIRPDLEISVKGECYYNHSDDVPRVDERPDIISNDAWNKILGHNKKIHNEMYPDETTIK